MTKLGFTIVAELDSNWRLTGNAGECRISQEEKAYPGSNFTTYGTWEAYEAAYAAQELEENDEGGFKLERQSQALQVQAEKHQDTEAGQPDPDHEEEDEFERPDDGPDDWVFDEWQDAKNGHEG